MESKINYTLVGLFVLLLGTAGIVIALWLSTGINKQHYTTYLVRMNEAVDGLSINAPVTFNGVDVGYVKNIRLSPTNMQNVHILLNIKEGIPIMTNTTATLRTQGITGVMYIGLNGGPNKGAEPLVAKPGQLYPEIAVRPSIRLRLDVALNRLMANMDTLSTQMGEFFNQQNADLLTSNLRNMQKISDTFANNSTQLNDSIHSMQVTLQNVQQSSEDFPSTMLQLQNVLQNLQSLSNQLQQNPSIIIRGKTNPPLGPGEGVSKQ